ncbi:hypothetical protein ASF58_07905 [Methylobacterium sp. Leaf125]|uniref:AAA family ATPase n=1 Tax=Methylobacterium sp. Leaf125 TaxID=1736265 RepID=UPI0006FF9BA3|nr:AAA family ATPase [Methylobacterium sp. Leaf125]KQQ40879.1 hypothetical protein ASF58_07905 [Methylobacterium sp. Leaf125]
MMEIVVESIVSDRHFGVIFSATILSETHADHGRRVRVRISKGGIDRVPIPGERWLVDGEVVGTRHGPQVEATSARHLLPTGRLVRDFLASHAPGIGQERAARLWSAFGEKLTDVLADEGAVHQIAEVVAPDRPMLALRLAAAAISSWMDARSEAAALARFDGHGVTNLAAARRAIRILGDDTVERLTANPYVLVPLLPWPVVDGIGLRVAAGSLSPTEEVRRQVGAADEAVKRALGNGDTMLPEADFRKVVRTLLKAGSPASVDAAVTAALRNGAVVPAVEGFRAPGAALMEDGIVERLRELMRLGPVGPVRPPSPSRLAELVADVTSESYPLHPQQADAVMQVLSRPVACLTGGGGTGKTYTCKVVCDAWERMGGEVLACALAGKAALRLSRSTRRLARTLARTLGELDEGERLDAVLDDPGTDEEVRAAALRKRIDLACLTPRTLILVDEASMVDVATMYGIVRRMPDGARLLLVGDPAQLPPVGFGLVFHRLVTDDALTSRLMHVHRQAAATGIPAAVAAVRGRRMPEFVEYAGVGDGVSFIEADEDALAGEVRRVAAELGILEGGAIVVTATNGGNAGVHALNESLHERHVASTGAFPMRGLLGRFFSAGSPVIFGRNDYRLGLFNGLLGRVVRTFPDEMAVSVHFEDEAEPRLLAAEHIVDLDLAYAVTCHKCQGSSAPRVVVPVYPSRVVDPSWLYTALTRGERQVVIVGDPEHFSDALEKQFAADLRRVGLRWSGEAA